MADAEAQGKIADAQPSRARLREMGAVETVQPDGSVKGRITGPTALRALAEELRPVHRLMAEHGQNVQSRVPDVTVRDPSGAKRVVKATEAEATCKKLGAKELVRRKPQLLYKNGAWYRRSGDRWVREVVN